MNGILCEVSVSSDLKQGSNREKIETLSDGFIRKQGGNTEIFYRETQPDSAEDVKVHVILSFNESRNTYECRIKKEGALKSEMLFIPEFETPCPYMTPFGELNFDIYTNNIIVKTSENEVNAMLSYQLLDGGEVITEAVVFITAKGKTCPGT